MKYKDYSAGDFANDAFFIRWVRSPDKDSEWFWTSFVREHPSCLPAVEEARSLVKALEFEEIPLLEQDQHQMRNHLMMFIRAQKEEKNEDSRAKRLSPRFLSASWVRAAAAIVVIPLVAVMLILLRPAEKNLLTSLTRHGEKVFGKKVNRVGEKSVLFLNDGTKVWLNGASKISYPRDFSGRATRDVYLEGEAFFDVAHDAGRPFIVHTSTIKIKVLGTSFNVKSYHNEKTVETTLVQGKVRIEQTDDKGNRVGDVELKPNQRAVFDKESRVINIKELAIPAAATWRQERLIFDEETMIHVIGQLEKWFDVKIHLDTRGSLDCRLTARIEKESLEEVLKLLETTHDIHCRIDGKDVFISGEFCSKGMGGEK